jgi:putative intracellular protease/amidase
LHRCGVCLAIETRYAYAMKVWFPLPDRDFDVTEVAVPWKLLVRAGHEPIFATETGAVPAADPLLLSGVIFGQLGAAAEPKAFYAEMIGSDGFRHPLRWRDVEPLEFDALWLAGGHAPGMKQYLGSAALHEKVAAFWATGRPVAAICHGVLVLARTVGPDGRSVLHGRRTTCLPKYMERSAYLLTAWKLGSYYRTYPAYVEDEVRTALATPSDFVRGPRTVSQRGSDSDDRPAFVVEDGRYLSARWPGDSYLLAKRLLQLLADEGHHHEAANHARRDRVA